VRIPRLPSRAKLAGTVLLFSVALAGCAADRWGFPYKVGVQQGNWITTEQVSLLTEGMTREQVRFALGTPTLTSVMHADRWEYPYFYRSPSGEIDDRSFTVFFRNGLLVSWEGDEQPEVQPFQIADDLIDVSKAQREQLELDAERAGAPTGQEEVAPGIDFSLITDDQPSTDPGALPDEPDAVPQELM